MTEEELKVFMHECLTNAKNVYLRDGHLGPVAILVQDEEVKVISLDYRDLQHKKVSNEGVRYLIKQFPTECALIISDIYYHKIPSSSTMSLEDARKEYHKLKDSEKSEGIFVGVAMKGFSKGLILGYKRGENNSPIFEGEIDEIDPKLFYLFEGLFDVITLQ